MKKKIFAILFAFLLIIEFVSPSSKVAAQIGCGQFGSSCCTGSINPPCGFGLSCQGGKCLGNPAPVQNPGGNSGGSNTGSTNNTSSGTSSELTCNGGDGINTAIGCINALGSQEQFLGDILKWAVGIGGGIAFLLILYAGFMIMSSAGDPTRLKAGQELLTSAISGLILLIFSIFILNFIGINILGIFK